MNGLRRFGIYESLTNRYTLAYAVFALTDEVMHE
jgi:hypothetical protein